VELGFRSPSIHPAQEPGPLSELPHQPDAEPPHLVLCVDDDAANRALVVRALARGERFRVATASTGAECLRLARELSPSVILLDWLLPDMSGGEVLGALSSDEALAHIPVVVLSGLDRTVTTHAPSSEAHPLRFVGKPYRLEELFAVVEDAAHDVR
jgi:CheY-like chemotaxis protein